MPSSRYEWLLRLPDPTAALRIVADSKVLLWANEAMRLNAMELREYVSPRRLTLLLAVLRHVRGQLLDELTGMLLKLVRKVEAKSEEQLTDWYQARHAKTDALIGAFHDVLVIAGTDQAPKRKVAQLDALFAAQGGLDSLREACVEHLRHEKQNWRPFARHAFAPLRAPLLKLAELLPLQATDASLDLLGFISAVSNEFPPYSAYYDVANVSRSRCHVTGAPWCSMIRITLIYSLLVIRT